MKNFTKKITIALFTLLSVTSCVGINNNYPESEQNVSVHSTNSRRDITAIVKNANAEYEKRNPELIKLKYKYMSESAFAFYRATAYIFYNDLASEKKISGINIPLQGDLHLENMGTYQTGTKKISYDLNDFDDAFTGPYTWDLIRCTVSIHLAAAEAGMDKDTRMKLVEDFLEGYNNALNYLQKNPALLSQPLENKFLSKHSADIVGKVSGYPYGQFLSEITANGKLIRNEKLKPVSKEIADSVIKGMTAYSSRNKTAFKVKDIAGYVSGKGSLGRYRYAVLVEGASNRSDDDIVLDIKEGVQPSIASISGSLAGNQAERIIKSTKYFVPSSEPYLGTINIGSNPFFVRQLLPNQKVELGKLNKKSEFKEHLDTVSIIVARAHARSGKTLQIINDLPQYLDKIQNFSQDYYKQVNKDFDEFKN